MEKKLTVFRLHSEALKEEWLDAYGHLNEASYLLPFANANWAFVEHFDVGVDYFERTGGAFYTLESHLSLSEGGTFTGTAGNREHGLSIRHQTAPPWPT